MKHKIKVPKDTDLMDIDDFIDNYIDAQVLERIRGVVSDGGVGNDVDKELNRQFATYLKQCIRDDITEHKEEVRVSLTTKDGKLMGMLYHDGYEVIFMEELKWLTEDLEGDELGYLREILAAFENEVVKIKGFIAQEEADNAKD